jgi:hypothetical protein
MDVLRARSNNANWTYASPIENQAPWGVALTVVVLVIVIDRSFGLLRRFFQIGDDVGACLRVLQSDK